jgi:hypothetical protein
VINAFSMPLVEWDVPRKRFYLPARKPSLYPEPVAKAKHIAARLQMVEQRTLRSKQFHASALGAVSNTTVKVCESWSLHMLSCCKHESE